MPNPTKYCISANKLTTGLTVYCTNDNGWSENIALAQIYDDKDITLNKIKQLETIEHEVIGVYLIEVTEEVSSNSTSSNAITPLHYREKIRLSGPSISSDLPDDIRQIFDRT